MSATPIAVTGLGLVTPAGVGARETWKSLLEGPREQTAAESIHGGSLRCSRVARVADFDVTSHSRNPQLTRLDPMIQFAVAAAREAHAEAGLATVSDERIGCVMGNGNGGITSAELEVPRLLERGPRRVSPYLAISMYYAGSIGEISIELGLKGPMTLVSTSETSGADALALASDWLRDDEAGVILAGGCEAPLTRHCLAAYERLGLLAMPDADGVSRARPYSARAGGFVLGEGAAVLALEHPEHAAARAARVQAEILGFAEVSLGDSMESAAGAVARAVTTALARSGCGGVDLVLGNGDALPHHDQAEVEGLRRVFGSPPPMTSLRPALGHAVGASAAIDAAVAVLALREGQAPPLGPVLDPADSDLDLVSERSRFADMQSALVLSIGVQGRMRALVVRRPERETPAAKGDRHGGSR